MKKMVCIVASALAALLVPARPAIACGCLAQPSPATPVVQAGERLLFAHEADQVVAYIQIQYTGQANQFGWLVPLPSLPTLELGTDEVFTKLGQQTQPAYQLTTTRQFCGGGQSSSVAPAGGCGGFDSAEPNYAGGYDASAASADMGMQRMNPVVVTSSIGPFDYAVLKADDSSAMLSWLSDNRYFVPAGTMDAVTPYIHPGAYFLALKLQSGQTDGDIVPIVVRYTSDLPMIPIILTSVGAVPDMGIQVWELGEARAIPRNYHHTLLDELPIWLGSEDYQSLVVRAMHEAPLHHSFITEYAGPSSVMRGVLDPPGRFGDLSVLRQLTDPADYLAYLEQNGYLFDSTLVAILARYLPEPPALAADGVTPFQYYLGYASYASYRDVDGGAPPAFDPAALTDELDLRIVEPTQKTAALFDTHPYLTRLFTTLSPEDMNADPVFSENPDLPDVPLLHNATVTIPCEGTPWLSTDQGFELQYPLNAPPRPSLPASLHVETLREAGPPQIDTDNRAAIASALGPVDHGSGTAPMAAPSASNAGCGGCTMRRLARANLSALFLVLAALLYIRRSARRRA